MREHAVSIEEPAMFQFILATAAALCVGKHTSHSDVRRAEPRWPGSSACPTQRDAAARLTDRALCGIALVIIALNLIAMRQRLWLPAAIGGKTVARSD